MPAAFCQVNSRKLNLLKSLAFRWRMPDSSFMESIEIGSVVWAPYADGEYRLRVAGIEGATLILKRPGSDAGTIDVPAAKCFPSAGNPHSAEEVMSA